MNNILTLEQIQHMSIDQIIEAYKNGYTLSETPQISENNMILYHEGVNTPQNTRTPIYHAGVNTPQIYSATNSNSHYTKYAKNSKKMLRI